MDLCKLTEILWKTYFSAGLEENQEALKYMDEDCIVIGTGQHEFYENLRDFSQILKEDIAERESISFHFKDLWCRQKKLGSDVCLVYGGLYIWWESGDKKIQIDMNSRFSLLYHQKDGQWRIVHIHQSLPNREQMPGEHYPKTLTEKFIKEQAKAERLTQLVQKDLLTGLINYHTFEENWKSWNSIDSWLFVADLDDFKRINDTYGHVAGNHILQKIADILSAAVRAQDIACRMGGDEFLLLCSGLKNKAEAERLTKRILSSVEKGRLHDSRLPGISIGGTSVRAGEPLESAMERADQALYLVKNTTKNGYRID